VSCGNQIANHLEAARPACQGQRTTSVSRIEWIAPIGSDRPAAGPLGSWRTETWMNRMEL
jgi:hypothetical protein